MTLSSWFRDYVYIPLGGNRVSPARFIVNIMTVWALTGFWHGADWNFIIWGAYFGVILLIEKEFLGDMLSRSSAFLRHVYVLVVIFISWALFDGDGLQDIAYNISKIFGAGSSSFFSQEALYYLRSYMIPLVVGAIGCTPIPKRLVQKLAETRAAAKALAIAEPLALGILLLTATAFMVDGSFNPFIYFRF